MIPLYLSITGFLSYREPVDVDFSTFELACIAGSNGAGKSSLLDAITWSLFGQARKRDDSVINSQSASADVCLTFGYEGNVYRVQRVKPRDKTGLLEFHILQSDWPGLANSWHQPNGDAPPVWKPLTERTLRETETRIQQTLRLDYETFVNAAFFLQGKADQFTQQRPGDRKRILGSILGLEVWETYRQRTFERRKAVELEITGLDGRLHEIQSELSEEEARKALLKTLEKELKRLEKECATQEAVLENIRSIAATLAEQSRLVNTLGRQVEAATQRLNEQEERARARREERQSYAAVLQRQGEIEAAYAAWQAARIDLERWEETAARFREHEKRREGPRDEINATHARLSKELEDLLGQQTVIESSQAQLSVIESQLSTARLAVAQAESQLAQRTRLDTELQAARQHQAEAKAENPRLKGEMDELKERIGALTQVEGAACPLCGQPLSASERENLIASLTAQGKELGDRYRANQNLLRQSDGQVSELEKQIAALAQAENDLRLHTRTVDQFIARLDGTRQAIDDWQSGGAARLQEISASLEQETFAPEAHASLAKIDLELKAIGYDAAAHDLARRTELSGRAAEGEVRTLERARAVLGSLEREIADLEGQIATLRQEVARQQEEHTNAAASLAAAQAQAPDLFAAENALYTLQEQENRLRLEVGAARQKVMVLEDLKARQQDLQAQREALAQKASQYKQLERAFGKDGVPALLIEQALPEIEARSNEILDRLSGGAMSVRFVTQSAYKDKRRDDLRETLEIQISDSAGMRDYEMFSGGEAFRVNFAIRLALSEILAQRAGARLQTLVIDEGFGSQDAQGRQRLLEAINLVRQDFAKILVITHIDELKDAFPNRIEVEKTELGSMVRVI